jgi:hypothetical protein
MTGGIDWGAVLRRAAPQGRLAYLRQRLDSGELRDERVRAAILTEVDELRAMLDAGHVPAPGKFQLRLKDAERAYLQALADQVSAGKAASASQGGKLTEAQRERMRDQYDRRVREGMKYGAIKALAVAFGVDRKTVSDVVHKRKR